MTILRRLPVLVLVFLVWAPPAFGWSRPVDGPVLQPYVYDESHPYAAGQHRGIDIGARSMGDPVVAPAAGTVLFAGSVPTSGRCVTIETADGYSVTLTHLGSIGVQRGATVAEGDVVGTVGPSGTPEVDGPYVHLGIRLTADPLGYVDPLSLLPAAGPPAPPAPPAPPVHSGSVGTPAPPVVASPPPPPAPAPASAPAPEAPSAPADPVSASPTPGASQPDSPPAAQDPPAGTARRTPAPGRPATTGSQHDVADRPDGSGGQGEGEAASGDTGSGNAERTSGSTDAAPDAVAPAPRHAHRPRVRASGDREVRPPNTGRAGRPSPAPPLADVPPGSTQRPEAGSLLSVVLGIGPGLVALLAAYAAFLGRGRRRAARSAVVARDAVVGLPRRDGRIRDREQRRAA